jgi:hypothetical protein
MNQVVKNVNLENFNLKIYKYRNKFYDSSCRQMLYIMVKTLDCLDI